jgi:hypothetical protein
LTACPELRGVPFWEAAVRSVTLLVILVLASFTDATAQELPLQPGQQVRVTAPALGLDGYVAEFSSVRDGALVLTRPRETVYCPLTAVSQLEAQSPGRANAGLAVRYGVLGMLLGGGVGVLVGPGGPRVGPRSRW